MISDRTIQEWSGSGVSLETIQRNVEDLDGQGALEFVLGRDLEKYSSQFVTAPLRRTLDIYEPLNNGGWKVSGLDSLNNWGRMGWGQLKPTTPRIDQRGKTVKYEAPKGQDTRAIFLDSPSVDWPSVQSDATVAVVITEGAKKAGTIQDVANIPAIALPGITSGIKRDVGLIPEIEALCQPGRLFILAFDSEPSTKAKTRAAIARETDKLRKELRKRGCYLVVASWSPHLGKGIDDVWANHGADRVKAIFDEAIAKHKQALENTETHKQQWIEQKAIAALNRWQKARRFSPTETTNQRYFTTTQTDILARTDILAVKSGMGTGKTEWLCRTLKGLESGAVMIGSRNSLLLQTAERLGGFYHLHSDSAFGLTADPHSKIATCIDSLVHFADKHFDGKILILDEWVSTLYHSLQSTTLKRRRSECLAKLEQAVKRASVVIALDGNNNDIAINHLIALRGGDCNALKILNEYQGDPKDIQIVKPINPQTGLPMVRSHSPLLQKLQEYAGLQSLDPSPDRAIAIISDSQRFCEALDQTLSGHGLEGIRIDSKTVETDQVRAFLKNPNQWIQNNQPDYVVLSPTAESGVDISTKGYFGRGFAFFCGVLDTNAQTQFINRFRDVTDWLVSCPVYTTLETHEGSRSPHAKEIEKHLIECAEVELRLILDGGDDIELEQARLELERKIKAVVRDQNTQTWAKLQAQRNYERQNTRDCLRIALEQQGHNVTVADSISSNDGLPDEIKEAREQIIDRDSLAIFNAKDIDISEAIAIKSKFGATVEDRNAAEKSILLARLPGIELSDQWTPELVKKLLFTDRALLANLERFWGIQNIDTAKAEAREKWKAIAQSGALFLPDTRLNFAKALALKSLNLDRLFTGEWHGAESEIVQQIYRTVKRSQRLQTALGLIVGKQSPIQFVGKLVKLLGGLSESRQSTTGDRSRFYKYQSPEADPIAKAVLNSIENRHQKKLFSKTPKTLALEGLEHEHPPRNLNTIQGEGVRGDRSTGQAFEGDRPNKKILALSDFPEFEEMKAIAFISPDDSGEILEFLNQFEGAIA